MAMMFGPRAVRFSHKNAFLFLFIPILILPSSSLIPLQQNYSQNSNSDNVGVALWNRTYGGPLNDEILDIVSVRNGGFAVVGMWNNPGAIPVGDVFLMRLDENGIPLWNRTYGMTIAGESIIEVSTGGFAIAAFNGWIIRTTEEGEILWNRTYQASGEILFFSSIIEMGNGNFAVIGYKPGNWGFDVLLLRVDSNGELLLKRSLTGPADDLFGTWGDDKGFEIIEYGDGGFIVAGALDGRLSLIRMNENGTLIWRKIFHPNGDGHGSSVAVLRYGDIALAGLRNGEACIIVVAHDDGTTVWERDYGTSWESVTLVAERDESFALAGIKDGLPYIARINNEGELEWESTYGNSDAAFQVASLVSDGSGTYVLAGSIFSSTDVLNQAWLLAVSDNPENSEYLFAGSLTLVAFCLVSIMLIGIEKNRRKKPK
ncbi:MAG: hypothetical protein ACFFEF_10625 [Candidatus Thorarchaeota archaeon]